MSSSNHSRRTSKRGLPNNHLYKPKDETSLLWSLSGTKCDNAEDKYRLLEKRDELIRSYLYKNCANSETEIIKGSLESMCSEKEVYLRIWERQICSYEMDDNKIVDVNKMIKKYRRSAADQKKPLPHEVRTISCLVSTINYLMNDVKPFKNKKDLARWYNFLWDRTRSIRKDLMQQDIINEEALYIYEVCARFHIYMFHYLENLSIDEFDPYLNNEQLMQCFISIFICYEYLNSKALENCNYIEFRCYEIAINLNKSNVLSKLANEESDILNSKEYRQMVRLVQEFKFGNYAKFFQIYKEFTNPLLICLVDRHIPFIRCNAIKTIKIAYNNTRLPVEYLSKVLAIEKIEEMKEFGIKNGLKLDENDCDVFLIRNDSLTKLEPIKISNQKLNKMFNLSLPTIVGILKNKVRNDLFPVTQSFDKSGRYVNDPILRLYLNEA
uniref:SAC3_GANP domain-containing protein n=1 Tax=Parastrongyloides trichosuri TaxID=131310 RepID=A0A0N4ZYC8_PARTI